MSLPGPRPLIRVIGKEVVNEFIYNINVSSEFLATQKAYLLA